MTDPEEHQEEEESAGWRIFRHVVLFLALGPVMPFIWLYQWFTGFEGLDERQARRRANAGIAGLLVIAGIFAVGLMMKNGWIDL